MAFFAIQHWHYLLKIIFVHLVECGKFLTVNVKYRNDPTTFPAWNHYLAPAFA